MHYTSYHPHFNKKVREEGFPEKSRSIPCAASFSCTVVIKIKIKQIEDPLIQKLLACGVGFLEISVLGLPG